MDKTRQSANLVSENNIFSDITNNRVGIGTTTPQGTLQVGTAITMYASTGIVSATSYRGDGSQLTGISAGNDITSCLFT